MPGAWVPREQAGLHSAAAGIGSGDRWRRFSQLTSGVLRFLLQSLKRTSVGQDASLLCGLRELGLKVITAAGRRNPSAAPPLAQSGRLPVAPRLSKGARTSGEKRRVGGTSRLPF